MSTVRSYRKVSSVDSAGTKQDIPHLLQQVYIRGRPLDLEQVYPFTSLPRILVPGEYVHTHRPPLMHYGWRANWTRLLELSEKHNALRYRTVPESDPDEEDEDFPGYRTEVDRLASINNVLAKLTAELAESPSECQMPLIQEVANAGNVSRTVISLYTNYELDIAAENPFVNALMKCLGEKSRPKWFVDDTDYTWVPYPRDEATDGPSL